MYDRAPRQINAPLGSTAESVGPGAYDIPSSSVSKHGEGYAPFGSMTLRESFLHIQQTIAPGPGQYDLGPSIKPKGLNSLGTRSKRFSNNDTLAPGPGAYNTKKYSSLKVTPVMDVNVKTAPSAIDKSRIKYMRQPAPPSIPTPAMAFGYEETDEGVLKQQDPPHKDSSMGPAYYNINHDNNAATKKYKGIFWSKQSGKRIDFPKLKETPGPGEYTVKIESNSSIEHVNYPKYSSMTYESNVPRYNEQIERDELKRGIPGPGKYEIPSQFDMKFTPTNENQAGPGTVSTAPPFGSNEMRFKYSKEELPAPGSYNDPRNALDVTKRIHGLKNAPFMSTEIRFRERNRKAPGPANYTKPGIGEMSLRKAYLESTRRGGFGSSAPRTTMTGAINNAETGPGPTHYQVKSSTAGSVGLLRTNVNQQSSVYTTRTKYPGSPPTAEKHNDVPPPGSYNVAVSFDTSQGKRSMNKPRKLPSKGRHQGFLVSANRFQSGPLNIENCEGPGPASYDTVGGTKANVKVGVVMNREQRFKDIKEHVPGPGSYDLSPLMMDTLLKGTFNATLNNPLESNLKSEADYYSTILPAKESFLLGI